MRELPLPPPGCLIRGRQIWVRPGKPSRSAEQERRGERLCPAERKMPSHASCVPASRLTWRPLCSPLRGHTPQLKLRMCGRVTEVRLQMTTLAKGRPVPAGQSVPFSDSTPSKWTFLPTISSRVSTSHVNSRREDVSLSPRGCLLPVRHCHLCGTGLQPRLSASNPGRCLPGTQRTANPPGGRRADQTAWPLVLLSSRPWALK